jgi:hypothetical protein
MNVSVNLVESPGSGVLKGEKRRNEDIQVPLAALSLAGDLPDHKNESGFSVSARVIGGSERAIAQLKPNPATG